MTYSRFAVMNRELLDPTQRELGIIRSNKLVPFSTNQLRDFQRTTIHRLEYFQVDLIVFSSGLHFFRATALDLALAGPEETRTRREPAPLIWFGLL